MMPGRLAFNFLITAALVVASVPSTVPEARAQSQPPKTIPNELKPKGKIRLLGTDVPAGTRKRLTWTNGTAIEGFVVPVPVIVLNGTGPGPVLCLTAAVHGDELNGIEVVRRVLEDLDVEIL